MCPGKRCRRISPSPVLSLCAGPVGQGKHVAHIVEEEGGVCKSAGWNDGGVDGNGFGHVCRDVEQRRLVIGGEISGCPMRLSHHTWYQSANHILLENIVKDVRGGTNSMSASLNRKMTDLGMIFGTFATNWNLL